MMVSDEPLNGKDQPCQAFVTNERDVYFAGPVPHQCPICWGWRYYCGSCMLDHHEGGWDTCKETNREKDTK